MHYESKKEIPFQSKEFPFIESVVAVTLIGMVAAYAVPRFTRLSNRWGGVFEIRRAVGESMRRDIPCGLRE